MPLNDKRIKSALFLLMGTLLFKAPKATPWIAGILLLIGAFLFLSTLFNRTYTIYLGEHPFSLNQKLIKKHLHLFWKERFPKRRLALDFYKNSLTIAAYLPKLSIEERQKVEEDLKQYLTKTLGYSHPILLTLHETPY